MTGSCNLSNKVALVSGSSKGIGKSIAQHLLMNGATVYLTGRTESELENTYLEWYNQYKGHVFRFQGDLLKTEIINELLNYIEQNSQKLDIVIANIGSGKSQMGWDVPDSLWNESMEMNFHGAIRLARESIKRMKCQKHGSILFISSIAGVEAIEAPVPYSCAKAALLAYMKNTSRLIGPEGIRMNAISPGNIFFEGGTWGNKMKENPNSINTYIRDNVPLQKFGKPEDIASLVCYLVSDDASFITGSNIVIDGGQTRGL